MENIYIIYKSEDSDDYEIGTIYECMGWHLKYDGADYRVLRIKDTEEWSVSYSRISGKYEIQDFTVFARNEDEALKEIRNQAFESIALDDRFQLERVDELIRDRVKLLKESLEDAFASFDINDRINYLEESQIHAKLIERLTCDISKYYTIKNNQRMDGIFKN